MVGKVCFAFVQNKCNLLIKVEMCKKVVFFSFKKLGSGSLTWPSKTKMMKHR